MPPLPPPRSPTGNRIAPPCSASTPTRTTTPATGRRPLRGARRRTAPRRTPRAGRPRTSRARMRNSSRVYRQRSRCSRMCVVALGGMLDQTHGPADHDQHRQRGARFDQDAERHGASTAPRLQTRYRDSIRTERHLFRYFRTAWWHIPADEDHGVKSRRPVVVLCG